MKTIKLIMAIMVALVCFTSCSSEEDGEKPNENIPSVRTDLKGYEHIWDREYSTVTGAIQRDTKGRIVRYDESPINWIKVNYGDNRIYGTVFYDEDELPFEITLNKNGYAISMDYKGFCTISYTKEGYLSEISVPDAAKTFRKQIQYLSNKIVVTEEEYGQLYTDEYILSDESSSGLPFHLYLCLDQWFALPAILCFDGVFGKTYPYLPADYANVKRDNKDRITSFNIGSKGSAKFYYE